MIDNIIKSSQKNWPIYAAFISLAMLAAAHAFETFANMAPCALCLHQREVYWLALTVGIAGFALRFFTKSSTIARTIDALLCVVFLSGAVIAAFHTGVERHWWQGLPECAGGSTKVPTDIIGALSKPSAAVSCDKIPWALFGLSMANYNVLLSIGLAIYSCICAIKGNDSQIIVES